MREVFPHGDKDVGGGETYVGTERNAGKGNREREREVTDELLEVGMKDASSTASSST